MNMNSIGSVTPVKNTAIFADKTLVYILHAFLYQRYGTSQMQSPLTRC